MPLSRDPGLDDAWVWDFPGKAGMPKSSAGPLGSAWHDGTVTHVAVPKCLLCARPAPPRASLGVESARRPRHAAIISASYCGGWGSERGSGWPKVTQLDRGAATLSPGATLAQP